MGNVTFSIDDEILKKAKLSAAKLDTSVNSIVKVLLENFANQIEFSDKNAPGNFQTLFDFSTGKINYRQAQSKLGVDDRMLFLMMCKAGLPMPQLSEAETKKMVGDAERVLYGKE
jgi:hypothetical protein